MIKVFITKQLALKVLSDKQLTAAIPFSAAAEVGPVFYQPLCTRPEERPLPCRTVAFLQAGSKSFDLHSEGWVTNSCLQAASLGCGEDLLYCNRRQSGEFVSGVL